jgi:tRNA isopentenyl-2-thiomethyl-A-37 hydroxylase MiaE
VSQFPWRVRKFRPGYLNNSATENWMNMQAKKQEILKTQHSHCEGPKAFSGIGLDYVDACTFLFK